MNDTSLVLKFANDSEFLISTSKLNQSFRVDGKKEFLKQSVQQWNVGKWFLLVLMVKVHFGIRFFK